MCACRQKKSFLIDDILHDSKKKIVKKTCCDVGKPVTNKADRIRYEDEKTKAETKDNRSQYNENEIRFNAITEVQRELDLSNCKMNLEQRRNTYPIHPTAIKPMVSWPRYRLKDTVALPAEGQRASHPFSFYSDPTLNTDHNILRSQLAANTFGTYHHPLNMGQTYGFDRVHHTWCNPWWGVGGRRKGGQVRFSAAQTSALERRFSSSIYLSPDERRALAASLRLSDRQVKTWFQNRRAKWRRTTSDAGGSNSPAGGKASDDET